MDDLDSFGDLDHLCFVATTDARNSLTPSSSRAAKAFGVPRVDQRNIPVWGCNCIG
jgi:hypothetical protein